MKIKIGWNYDTNYDAKKMGDWVQSWIWQELQKTFGRFYKQDSFEALLATVNLFGKLAEHVAGALGYGYMKKAQEGVVGLIKKLERF